MNRKHRHNPREVALKVLLRVLDAGVPLDTAWEAASDTAGLKDRDRGLAYALVIHTLRHLGQIDALIDSCLEKPLGRKYARVRMILRLGAAQLLFLRTPAHAAVKETVDLAHGPRENALTGLINAVLRRLGRDGEKMMNRLDTAKINTPDWLWESWCAHYGEATARRITEATMSDAPLDITVKGEAEDWASRLGGLMLPTGSIRLAHSGPVSDLPGYDAGAWWIQDAAAALPVKLFGAVGTKRVIDLCAAPGGKTAQLLAAGARITAVDQSQKRLKVLEDNLTRLGFSCETIKADARRWRPSSPADAVLLDAPCTGTGILRRHPDIRWSKTPEDLAALKEMQRALFKNALACVKPGGTLVYATCSLQPEEGEEQARWALEHPDVEPLPLSPKDVPGLPEAITPEGYLRTLPFYWAEKGGMDGFFAARFRRRIST